MYRYFLVLLVVISGCASYNPHREALRPLKKMEPHYRVFYVPYTVVKLDSLLDIYPDTVAVERTISIVGDHLIRARSIDGFEEYLWDYYCRMQNQRFKL